MKAKTIIMAVIFLSALMGFLIIGMNTRQNSVKNNYILSNNNGSFSLSSASSFKSHARGTHSRSANSRMSSGNRSAGSSFSNASFAKKGDNSASANGVYVPMQAYAQSATVRGRNRNSSGNEGGTSYTATFPLYRFSSTRSGSVNASSATNNASQELIASNTFNTASQGTLQPNGIMNAPNGGGGELPPPEGTPVGNGLWILMAAGLMYGVKKTQKVQ